MTGEQRSESSGDDRRVSKAQVMKFLERQFSLADRDQDGELTVDELQSFLHRIAHPIIDLPR
jgi:Ca2+-binding EF-hand superfamily protein